MSDPINIGIRIDSRMRRATCLDRFISGSKHNVSVEGGADTAGATGLLIILTPDACHVAAECELAAGIGTIDLATALITEAAIEAGVGSIFSLPFILCADGLGTVATGNAHIMSAGPCERVEGGTIALHEGPPGPPGPPGHDGNDGKPGDPADLRMAYDSEDNQYAVMVVRNDAGDSALQLQSVPGDSGEEPETVVHATESFVSSRISDALRGYAFASTVANLSASFDSMTASVSAAIGTRQPKLTANNAGDGISITVDSTTGAVNVKADQNYFNQHYAEKLGDAGALPVLHVDTSTNGEFRAAVIQIINFLVETGL